MSENTNIEWCDHTFNPWEGCQKVSPGCDHCYAETRNARFFGGGQAINWGPDAPRRRTSASNWRKPLHWQSTAKQFMRENGRRQRVFCASLADVFDNAVPVEWRLDLLRLIFRTPDLDWLLLTKRIGNVRQLIGDVIAHIEAQPGWSEDHSQQSDEDVRNWLTDWTLLGKAPSNVWMGASIVDQDEANRDIPKLLSIPAQVRFLSMEPLLGPVNIDLAMYGPSAKRKGISCFGFTDGFGHEALLQWVIVGGESGPGARPMHPDWARNLRDQCQEAHVPFLFKQWGEWASAATRLSTGQMVFREFPDFQTWVNKATTWVHGGICLDVDGRELKNGADMARARDEGKFPVTVMHRVGKAAAGRQLDGRTHDGYPNDEVVETEQCAFCGIHIETPCDRAPIDTCEQALNKHYGSPL